MHSPRLGSLAPMLVILFSLLLAPSAGWSVAGPFSLHQKRCAAFAHARTVGGFSMQEPKISQNAKLREEIEDPFAKLRLFVWPALFAAAGIATYFAATSLLAEAVGARPAAGDTALNLGVDLAALGVVGTLWRREVTSRDKRLQRITAGAALASLRVQLLDGGRSVKLSQLRARSDDASSSKRVVVIAAEEAALGISLEAARKASSALFKADLLVVPLQIVDGTIATPPPMLVSPTGEAETAHIGVPLAIESWREVLASELQTALSQSPRATQDGLTLILKKNGRVGTRRLGTPEWNALVADVEARAWGGLDVTNI